MNQFWISKLQQSLPSSLFLFLYNWKCHECFLQKKKQSIDKSTQRNRIHEKTFTNSNLSKMFYQISTPAWNMPEYGFFLTSIFLCKGRIADFFLYEKMQIRENPWSGVFYSVYLEIFWKVYVKFRRVKDLRLLAPAKKFLDSNVWKNRISKSWKYFIQIKRASLKTSYQNGYVLIWGYKLLVQLVKKIPKLRNGKKNCTSLP